MPNQLLKISAIPVDVSIWSPPRDCIVDGPDSAGDWGVLARASSLSEDLLEPLVGATEGENKNWFFVFAVRLGHLAVAGAYLLVVEDLFYPLYLLPHSLPRHILPEIDQLSVCILKQHFVIRLSLSHLDLGHIRVVLSGALKSTVRLHLPGLLVFFVILKQELVQGPVVDAASLQVNRIRLFDLLVNHDIATAYLVDLTSGVARIEVLRFLVDDLEDQDAESVLPPFPHSNCDFPLVGPIRFQYPLLKE